jgi:RNA polymerase sigma-70 factor (ECF subfamily)
VSTEPSIASLLARAAAERPARWLDEATFVAHARTFAASATELDALAAGDLFLACACGHGVTEAIDVLEREQFSRIREFAASVTTSPDLVKELAQQLRARMLVADGDRPPRILTYSGRGSLGGWIRVSAVRLARDLGRSERALERAHGKLEVEVLDPELAYLKGTYGPAVSDAIEGALAGLDAEARGLLKMHYVDGLTIEQVGTAFAKSRATAARMLAAARLTLVSAIRERLIGTVGVRQDEADSLLAFVRSQLDVSLARMLGSRRE